MILLLAACTSGPVAPDVARGDSAAPDSSPPADTAEGIEVLPGLSDTAVPPEPPSAPGFATLDCAAAIPGDGKTDCTLRITDADAVVAWEGPAGVGLHGRSSLGFVKPQYAVELRDSTGAEAATDLFGLGKEADWLLNGMYVDRALLRNKLAYDLYRDLTADREWAPESRYFELTLNGDYVGLYALCERVDRGSGRASVPADDGSGAAFIVKGAEAGIPSTVQYAWWEVFYPTAPSAAATAAITARLARMEAALTARDPALWDDLDQDSAVAFVLLEELTKNNDGFFLSHHLYTHTDGKLHFTPWDLDLSLGQPSYNDNENPASWLAYRPDIVLGLAAIPGFSTRMTTMWAEWRAGDLADDRLDARILGLVRAMGSAPARNFERWPIGDIQFSGYLYTVSSYEEEIERVRAFAQARVRWMDANVATWGG